MTDIHALCDKHLGALESVQLKRSLKPAKKLSPDAIDFSSNDYLGLSQHPDVIQAGVAMAEQHGAGSTGSRLLSGNLACFEALETQVAIFKNAQAALVYSSGYQANASALSCLLDPTFWGAKPLVFTDRLNHASLHHACQLAGVKQTRFRHNDLGHLEACLHNTAHEDRPRVIVTETVFGMDGDRLDIPILADLALKHKALVYLDEAHATGVWGESGRGLGASTHPSVQMLKALGLWVVMGTFSKAVGVSGAYVCCSPSVKSLLINRSTGFVYSTAPSPFVVGAVAKALKLIEQMDVARNHLIGLGDSLRTELQAQGFDTASSNTHIVPIVVGQSHCALALQELLAHENIVVSAIRPPTVAPNSARIRLALTVQHTDSTVTRLLQALGKWSKP